MGSMAPALRDSYLARLGLDAEPPSVEALFGIHRAHVERVPYETLWIHLGDNWGVAADEAVERIAMRGRGGYCFHLNGACSELLRSLGYDVVRHVGGVHGPDGATADAMANHLVLTVRDLPNDANPGGVWYVDVGLGDALHEPLPLLAGTYDQGPFRLVLEPTPVGVGDWHLTHDPKGWFAGMAWRSEPAEMAAFAERNQFLSTSPESGFVQVLTAARRDATGVDVLQGLRRRRIGAGEMESTITSRRELIEVLRDDFDLDLGAPDDPAFDALWARACEAHRAWEAEQNP
jgi:N-hydroxyarylamine O-acetyltransferase